MKIRTITKPERVQAIQSFLGDSGTDYLAARVLLLQKLPKQGATLASTAVEKAFKALLAINGQQCHGHLKTAHWNAASKIDVQLSSTWNKDFVLLCQKVYKLRYTDDLPTGFNLVIASREFLAELDILLIGIFERFQTERLNRPYSTRLAGLIAEGDPRITEENIALERCDRLTFMLRKPQLVYEIRNDPPRGVIEIQYYSKDLALAPGFLRQGLVPKDKNHATYEHSYTSMSYEDQSKP